MTELPAWTWSKDILPEAKAEKAEAVMGKAKALREPLESTARAIMGYDEMIGADAEVEPELEYYTVRLLADRTHFGWNNDEVTQAFINEFELKTSPSRFIEVSEENLFKVTMTHACVNATCSDLGEELDFDATSYGEAGYAVVCDQCGEAMPLKGMRLARSLLSDSGGPTVLGAVHTGDSPDVQYWAICEEVGRCYGGPEEGGWWYPAGELVGAEPFDSRAEANEALDEMRRNWSVPHDSSSTSYSHYVDEFPVGEEPKKNWPSVKPHYE